MIATETPSPADKVKAYRLLAKTIGITAEQEANARRCATAAGFSQPAPTFAADAIDLTTPDAIHRFLNS